MGVQQFHICADEPMKSHDSKDVRTVMSFQRYLSPDIQEGFS